jgi:hypothetical protein
MIPFGEWLHALRKPYAPEAKQEEKRGTAA